MNTSVRAADVYQFGGLLTRLENRQTSLLILFFSTDKPNTIAIAKEEELKIFGESIVQLYEKKILLRSNFMFQLLLKSRAFLVMGNTIKNENSEI
ncbi:hypothetical protein QTP88_007010 [Uroleucon formosanum]